MSWSSERKGWYAISAIGIFVVIAAIPAYIILSRPPSCSDGKQNGDERAVDCGGSCALLCVGDTRKPIVHWARSFHVSSGLYDAVAYIENQNPDGVAREAIYRFKLYDEDNVLIAERLGKTFMNSGETFAIFLGGIRTGEREPKRVFFEFEPDIRFVHEVKTESKIVALSPVLENPEERPRLTATLKNRTPLSMHDVEVVAILYVGENAVAASATNVEEIKGNGVVQTVFTWPAPISGQVTRIEIIPRARPIVGTENGK